MTRKLWLTFCLIIMAAVFAPAPGEAETDLGVLQKLAGDWTNLDGEAGRFVISFDVAGGLLKKGYLDPRDGQYKELNTTRIKFTKAKGQAVSLVSVDDATDSAECELKTGDQEMICQDAGASQVMYLKRYLGPAQ